MSHYIYGLHSGDHDYRYIGRSTQPKRRLVFHKVAALDHDDAPVYNWIRDIGIENVQMHLLEGPFEEKPDTVENSWAYFFRQQGYDLLNAPGVGRQIYLGKGFRRGLVARGESAMTADHKASISVGGLGWHMRWHANRGKTDSRCEYCNSDTTITIITNSINSEEPGHTARVAIRKHTARPPEPGTTGLVYTESARTTSIPGMQWVEWSQVHAHA